MITTDSRIAQLYVPQFEQFGLHLKSTDGTAFAETSNDIGSGSAWVMPLSKNCLIMEHKVTPARDMRLIEQTAEPYACVSEMNAETLSCMPENGITPGCLSPHGKIWPASNVCTFVQDSLHSQYSMLKAGVTYRSRSILFLSGFFDELEMDWPGEFSGLFEAFGAAWSDEELEAMTCALRQLSYSRTLKPGAYLHARSTVDAMVAELACARAARRDAERSCGDHAPACLAANAIALVDWALDQGMHLSVDEAAARLYVCRSKLCAVFKSEMGEGFAAYARRRRVERACELLADSQLSIAQVAARLGYLRQSTFSQTFRQACGESPRAWRERHLK